MIDLAIEHIKRLETAILEFEIKLKSNKIPIALVGIACEKSKVPITKKHTKKEIIAIEAMNSIIDKLLLLMIKRSRKDKIKTKFVKIIFKKYITFLNQKYGKIK